MAELAELIEDLTDQQEMRCAYGTREGDGRPCDCKFGRADWPFDKPMGMAIFSGSEQTGCPELRQAIRVLRMSL